MSRYIDADLIRYDEDIPDLLLNRNGRYRRKMRGA